MPPIIVRLRCGIQHYGWGDTDFIPSLLGIENARREPYAEVWMGAHPDLPAVAETDGRSVPLDELIRSAPTQILGPKVTENFDGRLPYLFKVLSAGAPLSIQVHPSKAAAREGFARENAADIPLSAAHRNYRDENHKPELITALTDFYGLRGFRPLDEITGVLRDVTEFTALMPDFEPTPGCLQALYEHLMSLPQASIDAILDPLIARLQHADRRRSFTRDDREYWVLKADRDCSKAGHHDRGLFSIYLLNLVHLVPGEAMFLPAGVLHAYLEGSGIEIMANSNNVLRGGLTPKHVDVPELIANITFEGAPAEIIHPTEIASSEWAYRTPACEFELRRLDTDGDQPHVCPAAQGAEILILVSTDEPSGVTVASGDETVALRRGDVLMAPHGVAYTITASAPATLYKATIPMTSAGAESDPTFRDRRPTALAFGTSGLRGLVTDITDLEAYINTRGFLDYLFGTGDVSPGGTVCIAGDRRPSTDSPDRSIMRAVARATEDAGLLVDNLGLIPAPALAFHAFQKGCASVMITGSHIPFDRNGIKFNTTTGEVLKADESGILAAVAAMRRAEYARPDAASLFADDGMFKPDECHPLPPVNDAARAAYLRRYLDFSPANGLAGKRIVYFQHSAVGRDLFVELLEAFGAEVHAVGRSEAFISIDTEDISAERLAGLQAMADTVAASHGPVDALLSTDGDSDRPLLCGIDADGTVRFYGGDLLGIVVADYLDADAVAVPISTNDAVDIHFDRRGVEPLKTKIGSPYVIASMQAMAARGHARVVGWEANGGFLLGSAIEKSGRWLAALPTRDAALPLLAALFAASDAGETLVERFAHLPPRFSKAGLIDEFPLETSRALVERFSPADPAMRSVRFENDTVTRQTADGTSGPAPDAVASRARAAQEELSRHFTADDGFGRIIGINTIDGVRIFFDNGDIAHIRPSGNAPQLRIYACSNAQDRADAIVAMGIRDPGGILRRLEAIVR